MQTKLSGFSRCNEVVVAEVLSYPLHTGLPEREYRTRKKNPETAAQANNLPAQPSREHHRHLTMPMLRELGTNR